MPDARSHAPQDVGAGGLLHHRFTLTPGHVRGRSVGGGEQERAADSVAVGNYLAREFGGGGGSELQNLSFLDYLVAEQTARGP
jgi:hypothetical protein